MRIKLALSASRIKSLSKTHRLMDLGFGGPMSIGGPLFIPSSTPVVCERVDGISPIQKWQQLLPNNSSLPCTFSLQEVQAEIECTISMNAWSKTMAQDWTEKVQGSWGKYSSQNFQCCSSYSMH